MENIVSFSHLRIQDGADNRGAGCKLCGVVTRYTELCRDVRPLAKRANGLTASFCLPTCHIIITHTLTASHLRHHPLTLVNPEIAMSSCLNPSILNPKT
jgi:hypothetical protein